MSAVEAVKANELGTNLERMERLTFAAYKLVSRYRDLPNYPDCQSLKSSLWNEYQDTLAELQEAINGH